MHSQIVSLPLSNFVDAAFAMSNNVQQLAWFLSTPRLILWTLRSSSPHMGRHRNWLVVWNIFYFPIIWGMSSSQLTFAIIFQMGSSTTNQEMVRNFARPDSTCSVKSFARNLGCIWSRRNRLTVPRKKWSEKVARPGKHTKNDGKSPINGKTHYK